MGKNPLLWATLAGLTVFIAVSQAAATIYNVESSGGGDFTTIQACANTASAGDTCLVWPGAYDERVSPVNSGSAGNPIIFQANGAAKVKAFTLIGNGYITIKGFEITHLGFTAEPFPLTSRTSSIFLEPASHIQIINNTIHDTEGKCIYSFSASSSTPSDYLLVQGNTLYKCGATAGTGIYNAQGIVFYGSHNLIQNNDISHIGDDFMDNSGGSFNIVRNNNLHDNSLADGPPGDDDHIDGLQNDCAAVAGSLTTHQLLIENNRMTNAPSPNTHFTLFQDQGDCGESGVVLRYNTVSHIGSGFTVNNEKVSGVRIYNNTVVNDLLANPMSWTDVAYYDFYHTGVGVTNGQVINNLYYDTVYNTTGVGGNQDWVDALSTPGFHADYNLGYNSSCGATCRWNNPSTGISTEIHSILNKDPLFVGYASGNFNLQSGSPAISGGGALTHVSSSDSGSGTTLILDNAGFFQDGYGMQSMGVQPDWIAIGSFANTVAINSINYATNQVTLASPIPRSHGDPVYLFKDSSGRQVLYGNVPDIGAYPYNSGSIPPPIISTPTAGGVVGLVNVYAYPNPVVGAQAPVIRVEMGVLSSITITIFDASGRTVNSTTLSGASPGMTANGIPYYDYPWNGHIASGIYYAVIHGKAPDGTIIRARTKIAVVR